MQERKWSRRKPTTTKGEKMKRLLLKWVLKLWNKMLYEEAEHGFTSDDANEARKKWVFARTVYIRLYHDYYPERSEKNKEI